MDRMTKHGGIEGSDPNDDGDSLLPKPLLSRLAETLGEEGNDFVERFYDYQQAVLSAGSSHPDVLQMRLSLAADFPNIFNEADRKLKAGMTSESRQWNRDGLGN